MRTANEAIECLRTGDVTELSLDHDLGSIDEDGREEDGYSVLTWVEQEVALREFVPPKLLVHSANPPAHERMLRAIEAINRRVTGS